MHFEVKVTEVAGLGLHCCCFGYSLLQNCEEKKAKKKRTREMYQITILYLIPAKSIRYDF